MTGLFDPAIFDADIFDVGTSLEAPSYGILRRLLADMEKISIGEYVFEPDVVEPGIDNYNCHTRRVLAKM